MPDNDSFDQWLDSAMKDQSHHIDDDGFSSAVIECLPYRPKIARWQQNVIVLISALIGFTLAAMNLPNHWIETLLSITIIPWSSAIAIGAAMLAIVSAIIWNDREKWI